MPSLRIYLFGCFGVFQIKGKRSRRKSSGDRRVFLPEFQKKRQHAYYKDTGGTWGWPLGIPRREKKWQRLSLRGLECPSADTHRQMYLMTNEVRKTWAPSQWSYKYARLWQTPKDATAAPMGFHGSGPVSSTLPRVEPERGRGRVRPRRSLGFGVSHARLWEFFRAVSNGQPRMRPYG